MLLLKILLKFVCLYFVSFLNRLLRFQNSDIKLHREEQYDVNAFPFFHNWNSILRTFIVKVFPVESFKNTIQSFTRTLNIGTNAQSNRYLLRLLFLNLKTNVGEDSEDLILKRFNLGASSIVERRPMGQASVKMATHSNTTSAYNAFENVAVTNLTNKVFISQKSGYSRYIDNTFFHQNSNSVGYLTGDGATGINFNALEDLYNYLVRFGDKTRLKKYPADSAYRVTRKIRKKNRIPKNFRGGNLAKKQILPYSGVTEDTLMRSVNTLKQIEYILKNRAFFEDKIKNGLGKSNFPHFSDEVKRIMFSTYTPVGAYGKEAVLYSGDLTSRNRVVVGRRVNLTQQREFVGDLVSFKKNVGFFNFETDEEMDRSSEDRDDENVGDVFFINPFVVLGFLCYSVLELFCLMYLMSFFFSTPYDTFHFFLKYPSVYFYENLTGFPSPNYFFLAVVFWISVCIVFTVHVLELVDEEEFDPPTFSWLYSLVNDIVYNFLIIGCLLFCVFEIFNFLDLMVSRVFFIGVPGYPNPFSIFFLLLYDIFYLLGASNYFSFYLENLLQLEVKFPTLYFSEYVALIERYPMVQPYFLGNPYLDRPNFFLWLADNFLNFISGGGPKMRFFSESSESRFVFQRELIQDVRKYNFIRLKLQGLRFVGQLHSRGWNGFNYRLDLQTCMDPIMPAEQVMRFDWRLKNSQTSGLHSRLFDGLPFGANKSVNTATKRITMTKGPRVSSRYGYLQYVTRLDRIKKRGGDGGGWYHASPRSMRKRLWLSKLGPGERKTVIPKRRFKSFLFSSGRAKFSSMLNEPRRVRTKSERNFKRSRIFRNFWSYLPGNDKPRRFFKRKPFISWLDFSAISMLDYVTTRAKLDKSLIGRSRVKLPKIGRYALRNLYLHKPQFLFSTEYINHRIPLFALKSQSDYEDIRNIRKTVPHAMVARPSRSVLVSSPAEGNFVVDNTASQNFRIDNKEIATPQLLRKKQESFRLRRRVPRMLKERRIAISKIPNFPFKHTVKHKFIARIYANFEPKYYLRHTAAFTTFSKLDQFVFDSPEMQCNHIFGNRYPYNLSSGLSYPFGLLFLGFGKFLSASSPVKLMGFDYYYSQNHSFLFSLVDNYLKKGQLRTLPTSSARFNHPLNGGLRYGWDFLYPMITELRLKEKLLPVDFLYSGQMRFNYKHLRLDPYESIRNSSLAKGPCYFLDTRIQNWLNFMNVIWNDYYHFFFNRSYRTEGNGAKFVLASYNPIGGPASYKLFVSSPTLETPRVGQFFFNYIPWLQYKFKWLLYPTSTYKRFDSFRFTHQHVNKKFYFTSLLKFYQMNLFRWQQASQIFQWNQLQARNFLLHLFFHKYQLLSELSNFRNLVLNYKTHRYSQQFVGGEVARRSQNERDINSRENVAPAVEQFNVLFFRSKIGLETDVPQHFANVTQSVINEFYVPSFTFNDFRFFQYVTDLRRWKALQAPYIRDWKFDRYIRYLGPLLHRDDVASLMGFFGPFEYRNQIFVSRLRMDSLRFSVFFPKKVIDEKFVNPLKRLNVPTWVPRSSRERIRSNGSSFYAFVLNRPFLLYSSNYAVFISKGKKILTGLYPHFQRFNLDSDLNFLYGHGMSGRALEPGRRTFGDLLYGESFFTELNSRKKRFLYDKIFWLSKSYELQNIGSQLVKNAGSASVSDSKLLNQIILNQLGKPLDLPVPKVLARFDLQNNFKLRMGESSRSGTSAGQALMPDLEGRMNESVNRTQTTFTQRIHPDIFARPGGPKLFSKQWQMGQSWLKFVVASQNVSVAPVSSDSELLKNFVEGRVSSSLNDIISPIWPTSTSGYTGVPSQSKLIMSFDTRPKHGYFNFGLSGVGRLPRLSRSFFHMLFFRNKLDDFKCLKTKFLKLYLMSVPLFNNSDFASNASFKLFWSFILGFDYSTLHSSPLRYLFIFNNMLKQSQTNFEFSSLLNFPELGTLVSVYSPEQLKSSNVLFLHDQYVNFKAYKKYQFFINSASDLGAPVNSLLVPEMMFDKDTDKTLLFESEVGLSASGFLNLFQYVTRISLDSFKSLAMQISFNVFNYIFMRPRLLKDPHSNSLIFVNKFDQQFGRDNVLGQIGIERGAAGDLDTSGNHNNMLQFATNPSSVHDFFRGRFFFGSFRSTLHWYFYPIHHFFSVRDYLSKTIAGYIYQYLRLGLALHFRYGVSSSDHEIFGLRQISALRFQLFGDSFTTAGSGFIQLRPQSDFLRTFYQLSLSHLSFISSPHFEPFTVYMLFRVRDPIVLRTLFCFGSLNSNIFRFNNTFSAFFFAADFLKFVQKWNTNIGSLGLKLDLRSIIQTEFASDFDFFTDNLFGNAVSIDGSGRNNRPRSAAQTLDAIFSYREYEKYRREHHRQRFRSISPYWLQNTFRNRAQYAYGYRSPENRRRRQTHAALVAMLKRVARLDRYKLHPAHTNRISFFGALNPEQMVKGLLYNNNVSMNEDSRTDTGNSNINFVDVVGEDSDLLNFQRGRFLRTMHRFDATRYAALDLIRSTKQQRSKLLKKQIFERQLALLPDRRVSIGAVPSYEHRFYRTPLRPVSEPVFSEYGILLALDANSKDVTETPESLTTEKFAKHSVSDDGLGSSRGSASVAKRIYRKQDQFQGQMRFDRTVQQDMDALKLVSYPFGFYSDGGNFINSKKPPSRNDLFQTPGFKNPSFFESAENLDLFYESMLELQRKAGENTHSVTSQKEFLDERRKSLSPRADGGSASVRQRAGVDAFHEVSPRYLRVPKPRRKMVGLSNDVIGGIPSSARRNKTSYPGIMVRRTSQRGVPRGLTLGAKRYPVNVKRFVRSKARVLMYIPYLYSKWFTQNPRLSSPVSDEFLNIFINNQFDEFNYICVQSLFLLKRKIMFNYINLKLIAYRQQILYFSPLSADFSDSKSFLVLHWFDRIVNALVKYLFNLRVVFQAAEHLQPYMLLDFMYAIRGSLISLFFQRDFRHIRLLYNPLVSRFKHESGVSGDMLYFEEFYYRQTAKRVLSQVAFLGHSVGGWQNPLGLVGQYIPGLSFYSKGPVSFNFNYQNPDLFSNRYFSPEILLDNNLKRQSSLLFDRNFFFNEFFISPNYKRAWHFLAFRVLGPSSPFIEYDRLHNFPASVPSSIVKHMHRRLPLMSLRRVSDIAPNHIRGFFDTLITDASILVGHDITLPLKLKLLNFSLRQDPFYQRVLHQFFLDNSLPISARLAYFSKSLKSKQFSVLIEFYNRMNLESLVNKRRLGFRKNVWSPFRYNVYYKFNWRSYLHRFSTTDEIGFRRYKLSPFFDINHGKSVPSLKSRALQHLIVSQIPRFELDARRRVPLNISAKEFNLLFFLYFKYVNENFTDSGYGQLDAKIFRYVNRKIHPFLTTFLLDRNPYFQPFWPRYFRNLKYKLNLNEKVFDFKFRTRQSQLVNKVPKYTSPNLTSNSDSGKNHVDFGYLRGSRNVKGHKRFGRLVQLYNGGITFINKKFIYFAHYVAGRNFLSLLRNPSMNLVLSRKFCSESATPDVHQAAKFIENAVQLAGFERPWLHELVYETIPAIYQFIDRYILFNPKPYLNVWYMWFQPFTFRSSRFLFLVDYWSRSWGAINQGRPSKHSLPGPAQRYLQYGFFSEWWTPKISVSRIFGVHKLFLIQRHRERALNPAAWLNFDLFSRVRPAFRPFLIKFSKQFMFSKIIPSRGVPSYSSFIKSHTKFDNYFERHPYIAFSLGLGSTNNLMGAEGAFKEIRSRSQMLDFARRQYRNSSPVNFKTRKHGFYDYSLFRKNRYVSKRKARLKRSMRAYQEMNKLFPFFSRFESQFFNSHVRLTQLSPPTGARFGDWSSAETFLDTYGLSYPLRSRRQRLRYLPMTSAYSRGFLKDANFFAVMARPWRSVKLMNIVISRPYTTAVKFLRSDDYPTWSGASTMSKLFVKYGSFNPLNFDRWSSYYQPNLKTFFDFNAYKQRYNLALLFRGLSFERDFQLFLLHRAKFVEHMQGNEKFFVFTRDIDLLANFTNLSTFDYFNFLIPQGIMQKGYLVESRLSGFYFTLERFILKLNLVYILIVVTDCYLMFLFSLVTFITFVHKFDFVSFLNIFDVSDNIIYYAKKRPIFQIFFHIAVFKEYLKFSWLFSIKFLLFNIDYYPYYFLVFAILLIMRRLSLNFQRSTGQTPFVVPHMWRFADLQFNFQSGWFDRAWSEVKWEAVQRLKELHTTNAIEFEHDQLLSFDDIRRFKRKYKLKGRAGKFLELEEDEKEAEKVDFSKFDNLDSSNPVLGKPVKIFSLKGWFSRLRAISFLPASIDPRISDDMHLSDTRKEQPFRRNKKFRRKSDIPLSSLKAGGQPEDLSAMDSVVTTKRFDLREKPALSFFWFRKQIALFLRGRITFSKFIADFRIGSQRYSDRNISIGNYDVDDFSEEFHRLFLDPAAELNSFITQDLVKRRMMPDDENIHFYRKPGSVLHNEIMLQKFGTEPDQLHYVIEFPGRFNRTYVNAFSRAYAIRNLNYNQPQYGFLSFPRSAKLPTTFEEFVVFCGQRNDNNGVSESMTENPENTSLNPNLVRLRELWNLFQYVTKYEYNMLNEYSVDDTRLVRHLIEDRPVLFDNVKFWVNKAAVDAVHFNFLKPSFFSLNATVDEEELVMKGADSEDRLVNLDLYRGREDSGLGTISPLLSLLYMFYIYLFLFVFFMVISLLFCFGFLLLYSIWNYVNLLILFN